MATQNALNSLQEITNPGSVRSSLQKWAPPFDFGPGQSVSGVEAAIAVVRRILSIACTNLRAEYREIDNPLLRYAWLEFPHPPTDIVKAEQEKLWRSLGEHCGGFSFAQIIESEMMLKTLWALPSQLLVKKTIISSPDLGEAEGEDDNVRGLTPPDVAAESLMEWDGVLELGYYISFMLDGMLGNAHQCGRAISVRINRPAFLRVSFTPILASPRRTWDDLLTIRIGPVPDEPVSGKPTNLYSTPGDTYRLFAVVRLRAREDTEDKVRLYMRDGDLIDDRAGRSCTSGDWALGESGHQYYLFYARAQRKPRHGVKEFRGGNECLGMDLEDLLRTEADYLADWELRAEASARIALAPASSSKAAGSKKRPRVDEDGPPLNAPTGPRSKKELPFGGKPPRGLVYHHDGDQVGPAHHRLSSDSRGGIDNRRSDNREWNDNRRDDNARPDDQVGHDKRWNGCGWDDSRWNNGRGWSGGGGGGSRGGQGGHRDGDRQDDSHLSDDRDQKDTRRDNGRNQDDDRPDGAGHLDVVNQVNDDGTGHLDVVNQVNDDGNGHSDVVKQVNDRPDGNGPSDIVNQGNDGPRRGRGGFRGSNEGGGRGRGGRGRGRGNMGY